MESDLSLINKIKACNDEQCLMELIERHSGIYVYIVDQFTRRKNTLIDKDLILKDKDYMIYKSALNYNPDSNSKFSTYLANETKWNCLNHINKNKKRKETSLDDISNEPFCKSTSLDSLIVKEALGVFSELLNNENDPRVKKIIDMRYNSDDNKVVPWRTVAKSLKMSIQGCINIHNKFINKVKKEINKHYV
jgi:DNA-directed RNA polymerase specialized sigma subunit